VKRREGSFMSLFDRFKTRPEPKFNTQKSMMTIVVAAIMADGKISDEEVVRLRSMCANSPVFSSNTRDEDDAVIGFAQNASEQLGIDAIRRAAEGLTPELRETAFAYATEMVLADTFV
jgi:creatinine amidohydrolase/Fe(II)-dependent formamide hydrolase-like protein